MDDRLSVKGLTAAAAVLLAMARVCGAAPEPNTWHELAPLPLTWIQDLSFVSARVGFAAGGDGQVLRTIDGGVTWEPVIDEPQPYYWYGVHALTPNDIVASGFYNSINAYAAMIRWSHDGGDTWSDDLVLSTNLYVQPNRVHFWNSQLGFAATRGGTPDLFRTTSGGLTLADWSSQTISDTWFGAQFSALPNGHVRISGINYCESLDYTASWSCRPSIDPGSDWATFFLDDKHGWVGGGGGIGVPAGDPPKFEGWVHLTTDGGANWSDRTLDVTWPIRSILFVNKRDGWAMGGYAPSADIAADSGGAYISHDGGETWSMEADVGVPFEVCATADYHLFCAGTGSGATSHVFERDFDHIRVAGFDAESAP
jgi:photosystem II stability/assembly factor-like uncharacterized protein